MQGLRLSMEKQIEIIFEPNIALLCRSASRLSLEMCMSLQGQWFLEYEFAFMLFYGL